MKKTQTWYFFKFSAYTLCSALISWGRQLLKRVLALPTWAAAEQTTLFTLSLLQSFLFPVKVYWYHTFFASVQQDYLLSMIYFPIKSWKDQLIIRGLGYNISQHFQNSKSSFFKSLNQGRRSSLYQTDIRKFVLFLVYKHWKIWTLETKSPGSQYFWLSTYSEGIYNSWRYYTDIAIPFMISIVLVESKSWNVKKK